MNSLVEYFSNHINITNDTKDRIKITVLFDSYSNWKKSLVKFNIEKHVDQTSFNSFVNKLGIKKRDSNGHRFFDGVSFKSEEINPSSVHSNTIPVQSFVNTSSPKEIVNVEIPKNSQLIKMIPTPQQKNSHPVVPIPQPILLKPVEKLKQRLHDNFIKFKDFSLHTPSFSAVTGKMPQDVTYLFENPLDLNSILIMLGNKTTSGLSDLAMARIYSHDIKSIFVYPPNKAAFLIFSSGLKYSRLTFHRDLLLSDTYDELYSYCSTNPVLVKEIKT
jgi:hypothetical protein